MRSVVPCDDAKVAFTPFSAEAAAVSSEYRYSAHGSDVLVVNIGSGLARFGFGSANVCEHVIPAADPQVP